MYKRKANGWLKHIDFILCDVLALLLSFFVAYMLRFDTYPGDIEDAYAGYTLLLIALDFLACILFDPMRDVLKRGYYLEFVQTVKHASLVFAMLAIQLFAFQRGIVYSRIVLFLTVVFHVLLGYGLRLLYKGMLRKRILRDKQHSILIIAPEAAAESIVESLKKNTNDTMCIAGLVLTDRDAAGEVISGVKVVANMSDAAEYACREWVDEVFINAMDAKEKVEKLSDDFSVMGITVHEYIAMERHLNQKQFVENIGGYMVLTSAVNEISPLQALIKRVMDIVGGIIGCIAAVLIIAIVGPIIKKQSPGPILYSQERVGLGGKKFRFYKIRSMHLDADERKQELMSQNRVADGMMFKLDFDPRIIGNEVLADGTKKTGIGAFIRNTSLDEFPQFFNVLKGDMSLVGTRPPTVDEWERYEFRHRARLAVKPGITGLWQVSGRSAITDFEEIVKLDTQYICNWSLGLDIKILLKTVKIVFNRDGAM